MILRTSAPACLVLGFLLALESGVAARGSAKPPIAGIRRIDPPAGPGSLGPDLARVQGGLLLSWLEPSLPSSKPGEGPFALRYAVFDGRSWSDPRTILSGGRFFANWADFPSVAQSPRGWLLAHWAERSGDESHAYDVQLARADGLEGPWRRLGAAHDDRTETEHGFVSFVPEKHSIRAFWLDGRETGRRSGASHGHGEGGMTLRTALVGDTIAGGELLDPRVCDCCQTSAAVTSEGPVIVYRDRSETEIRDVSIIRRKGNAWTDPRSVAQDNWEISGCPVNGPSVDADGRNVAVAWFTAAGDRPRVQVAFSKDAGATFGASRLVDGEKPLGRVAVVVSGGSAFVSWVATEGKKASIRLRRFSPESKSSKAILVAETSSARSSGFPRLARSGNSLLLAWVEAAEPARIRAAVLDIASIP